MTMTNDENDDDDDSDGDGDGDSGDDDDDGGGRGDGGGGDDDDVDQHRRWDECDHADVAVPVWTSDCERGYARFMLAVWAGRGAQAASCLVIKPTRSEVRAGFRKFVIAAFVSRTSRAGAPGCTTWAGATSEPPDGRPDAALGDVLSDMLRKQSATLPDAVAQRRLANVNSTPYSSSKCFCRFLSISSRLG